MSARASYVSRLRTYDMTLTAMRAGHILDSGATHPRRASMLDQPPLAALDESRFAEIFAEYQVAVFRYLRARTNNAADADDLTSETFLRAWRFRDNYVEQGMILSWLYTVARGTL